MKTSSDWPRWGTPTPPDGCCEVPAFRARQGHSYFLAGGDADDLLQEGYIGLFKAIRDYRPDRAASFRSFAELCVTRQIITAIKTASRARSTPR